VEISFFFPPLFQPMVTELTPGRAGKFLLSLFFFSFELGVRHYSRAFCFRDTRCVTIFFSLSLFFFLLMIDGEFALLSFASNGMGRRESPFLFVRRRFLLSPFFLPFL